MIPDLANIVVGAYKGFYNASGIDVDPSILAYAASAKVMLDTAYAAALTPTARWLRSGKRERTIDRVLLSDPLTLLVEKPTLSFGKLNAGIEGSKAAMRSTVASSIEIAVGYGLGYVFQKITN